jgi:general nucleoside transport system permease protein
MFKRIDTLIAPLVAVLFSVFFAAIILLIFGANPIETFLRMFNYATTPRSMALILNSATTYYFSAVAVAIGFKMNLFNIGVNGQYRLATAVAALVAGYVTFPGYLGIPVIIFVSMLVGAAWAGIAAWLKVVRGVSEVISTIMLNFIAIGLIAYIMAPSVLGVKTAENVIGTPIIPQGNRFPGVSLPGGPIPVYGMIFLAMLLGFTYWYILNRTRFGFDLRAVGMSPSAAVASGVNVKRMTVYAMLLSGAVAGLVGLPLLLGAQYTFTVNFPGNYGFTGIAIALLGRNHPVGIAFGALLWAFLDVSAQILDLVGVPREIIVIMQGVIVLSVVIAYEVTRRIKVKRQQAAVGSAGQ